MIIYINGYWNRIASLIGISPGTPEESYWNHFSSFFISSSGEFMDKHAKEASCFIDGSSLFGIDQYASDRYQSGYKHGNEHYNEIVNKLRPGESFKFVSHSEGGAFAAGLADLLLSRDQVVEKMLYLSPREGDAFNNPRGVFAIQAHFNNDPVCLPRRIPGVAVYVNLLILDEKKAGLFYAHGGTIRASTIKRVQKVLKMLPYDTDRKLIKGCWTINETEKGYDFIREADCVF